MSVLPKVEQQPVPLSFLVADRPKGAELKRPLRGHWQGLEVWVTFIGERTCAVTTEALLEHIDRGEKQLVKLADVLVKTDELEWAVPGNLTRSGWRSTAWVSHQTPEERRQKSEQRAEQDQARRRGRSPAEERLCGWRETCDQPRASANASYCREHQRQYQRERHAAAQPKTTPPVTVEISPPALELIAIAEAFEHQHAGLTIIHHTESITAGRLEGVPVSRPARIAMPSLDFGAVWLGVPATKLCPDCGQEKPWEEYYRDRDDRTGRSQYCIPCKRVRSRGDQAELSAIRKQRRQTAAAIPAESEPWQVMRRALGIVRDDLAATRDAARALEDLEVALVEAADLYPAPAGWRE